MAKSAVFLGLIKYECPKIKIYQEFNFNGKYLDIIGVSKISRYNCWYNKPIKFNGDRLIGFKCNDLSNILNGGSGNDTLNGGAGADRGADGQDAYATGGRDRKFSSQPGIRPHRHARAVSAADRLSVRGLGGRRRPFTALLQN